MAIREIINKNKDSLFTCENKYGYKLNINNKRIREYYERYKAWKKIPLSCPLSDKERFEFEQYLLNKLLPQRSGKN